MRAFALLLALGLTAVVLYCAYMIYVTVARRGTMRLREQAVWRTRHYSKGGHTIVAVGLTSPGGEVLDEHVVARLPDESPDWKEHFLHAQQEAEERAFHLNKKE